MLMRTPKRKKSVKGTTAQRRIAKEANGGRLPLTRQVNLVVEEMDRFLAQWCLSTEQWFEAHAKEIEKEHKAGGGETGMTGKSCLIRSLHVGANRLLQLAQALDNH